VHAQLAGLLALEHSLWQWAWVAGERGSMSPDVVKSACAIQTFGQEHEIPELTYAELGLGQGADRPWFNAEYLAMIACHVCNADFYVAMPAPDTPNLMMYWIVRAPELVPKPANEMEQFGLVVNEAMSTWSEALRESKGRELIRAYAEQKHCIVSEDPSLRMRVDGPAGGHIFIDFEESGAIYGIEFPQEPVPEPKKPSWFKGLFRGSPRHRAN
jgi:hypothetical protein